MITLDNIRDEMKKRLEIDNSIHFVEVNADTIDEALADGSVQLNCKVSNLQYEIIEKGSDGIVGIGKKPWKLKIYQDPSTIKKVTKLSSDGLFKEDELEEQAQTKDQDGLFYIRHFGQDVMLKVILPVGNGNQIDLKDVIEEIKRPDTLDFNESLVKKYVKSGTNGEYCAVGNYKHVSAGDVLVSIDITKDEMKASILVSPPSMSGAEASKELILRCLTAQGVIEQCIDLKKIDEFVDNPVYNVPYEVAAAIAPVNGKDAYVSYNFETDPNKLHATISDSGNINYKELNKIQNVIAGQPVATKMPPERGVGGKTVFGRYLEATNGKDVPIQLGQNVRFDKDGQTIIAEIDGEVMLLNGRITVEPVKYVDGVNVKTGDIKFVGTVIIKGPVEDGYKVEATNIEVHGIVNKARLEAVGNIVVQSGIFGKGEGYIKAGKSIWARFINDSTVEAEENVIVNDSIVNSNVTAMKNIIVRGKKAQIIGGHLLATEEICAKKIGSPSGGTETILEVGIDPRAKKRLLEIQKKQADFAKEIEAAELDIQTLEQQKKLRKKLPQDKEEKLNELKIRKDQIQKEQNEISVEVDKIQDRLKELKAVGKVKAEDVVYAGVKVFVRDVLDEVKMDVKGVTFYYDKSFCKRGEYEPPSFDIEEPDGYSAN